MPIQVASRSARPGQCLCFVDIETTGSRYGFHEIIDVGAIRTTADGEHVLGTWHCRIAPRHPERLTAVARALNGFSTTEWHDARLSSSDLWLEFAAFAADATPVAHNPSFDRPHIEIEAAAVGVSDLGLDYHWIGTESLGWPLYMSKAIPKPSLRELCLFFDIPAEAMPHTAIGGAEACRLVYSHLMRRYDGLGTDFWR